MSHSAPRPRTESIPNANSPQLLSHMLEVIARGVRSTRGLQEALGVDPRTVGYYLQAGAWLGMLVDEDEPILSPVGLEYVYAGINRRKVYARAVFDQPFVRGLLPRGTSTLPSAQDVTQAILEAAPELSPSTARRRASSVRGLIAPALDPSLVPEPSPDAQLDLPLAQQVATALVPSFAESPGRANNPDIYRFILCALLDHGELTLGHVRALLDRSDAGDVPLGAYIDLAVARGDASKQKDRLVVSVDAMARVELSESTTSVILSDAGWRDHLDALREAIARGESTERMGTRYRLWNERLFGHPLRPESLEADLTRVLRDRSLEAFPRTRPTEALLPDVATRPFLDVWPQAGLLVTLPPPLAQLWEGVGAVNRRLRNARHRNDAVQTPTPAYRPLFAHGGLLHPREPLPRVVADAHALRERLVRHAPYICVLVAMLRLHRRRPDLVDVQRDDASWTLHTAGRRIGSLLGAIDAFGRHMGWLVSRRPRATMRDTTFVDLLSQLALVECSGPQLMLHDAYFDRLRRGEDGAALTHQLDDLSDTLAAWLEALPDTSLPA